jgi:CubicO group peptidase (beta-lactamase class C family)
LLNCAHALLQILVCSAALASQADGLRERFASAAGTPERPAASIAWISHGKTQVLHIGHTTLPNGAAPTDDTIYEIGSITKTFTATLLADMVINNELTRGGKLGHCDAGRCRRAALHAR